MSEASSIVQEAAHEDANIIFGAVVDPSLKGKVKITVIATGFGPPPASRSMNAPLQTPVDMTHYTDHARMRVDAGAAASASAMDRGSLPRMSIARRGLPDLPLAASGAAGAGSGTSAAPDAARDSTAGAPLKDADDAGEWNIDNIDPEADSGSAFDVPAFLRRQEG